jgi:D-serine deaminase-like pyridoxal phosphate-dependent protein
VRADELAGLLEEPLDWRYRARPADREPLTLAALAERRWNLLAGDLLLPAMVLKESALDHNLAVVARYCRDHGVSLAPHGKTTMAPQLFERQLEAGAWGMTAATVSHVGVYRQFGVPRVLLMNELVEPAALRWIADELTSDGEFDFYCLVDSVAGVEAMTEALRGTGLERPLQVLVELGIPNGRAGCRTQETGVEVAKAAAASPALELAGVEGFEGIIAERDLDATLAAVDEFLARMRALTIELARAGSFAGREEIVVTAGGSAFFDRVVACLTPEWGLELPVRVVLRGGCYLTHDSGLYERISPIGTRDGGPERLRSALETWGVVLSRPEPDLAIVGFGKRDVPFDIDLPIPTLVSRNGELRDVRGTLTVTALNDQHAYVRLAPGAELAVGELLGCGISHPCLAFDKWPLIPLVDDDYTVVGGIRTFF